MSVQCGGFLRTLSLRDCQGVEDAALRLVKVCSGFFLGGGGGGGGGGELGWGQEVGGERVWERAGERVWVLEGSVGGEMVLERRGCGWGECWKGEGVGG